MAWLVISEGGRGELSTGKQEAWRSPAPQVLDWQYPDPPGIQRPQPLTGGSHTAEFLRPDKREGTYLTVTR